MFSQFKQKKQNDTAPSPMLPLVELHVHVEGGTLTPSILTKLATKHGLPEPRLIYGNNNTLHFKPDDFDDFLATYDIAARYILTVEDIEEIAYAYLQSLAEQGAIYVELTCSPEHVQQNRSDYLDVHHGNHQQINHSEKSKFKQELIQKLSEKYQQLPSIDYNQFIQAVARAIDRAKFDFDIDARILVVLLRHNGFDACMKTLHDVINHPHPYVVGINLAGDEKAYPARDFVKHYQKAKKAGLKLTAHVGEHTGPEHIKEAIELLQLDRVGHGTSAGCDEALLKIIAEKEIGIEVNLTSNLALGVIKQPFEHPLEIMLFNGVLCSLSTDDPTYFNTTLRGEYDLAKRTWDLDDNALLQITMNAIRSAFCEDELKRVLFNKLNEYRESLSNRKLKI